MSLVLKSFFQSNQRAFLLILTFLVGLGIWCSPTPEGVSDKAWQLFAIFIATIFGIVANPIPMGAISLISICVCVLSQTISLEKCLSAFGTEIVWLVVFAFFIAQGFIKTGLGSRFAYYFISKLGKSTLGLSYGLVLAEFTLSPLIPSVTARGGGIMYPIASSLCKSFHDRDHKGVSSKTAGFIMQVCYQANVITSSLFITAIAANPLVVKLAANAGVEITWVSWAYAAIVPGVINLLLMPLTVYFLYPPSIKKSETAPELAKQHLREMGKMKWREWVMLFTFVLLISLWIAGPTIGVSATTTALIGFSVLMLTNTINFDDILADKGAWHTFLWFATLVMLSGVLAEFGMMKWVGTQLQQVLPSDNFVLSVTLAGLFYFYIHYLFASTTAHITVLFPTILVVMINLGVPAVLAAQVLGFFSVLSGGITHFSIGSAPIYFGSNYMKIKSWWYIGFMVSLLNLIIWCAVGSVWWKYIGLY